MPVLGYLCLSLLVAYGCGLATPLVWIRGPAAWAALAIAVAVLLAVPLFIPADHPPLPGLVSFLATDMIFKLIDFRRHVASSPAPICYRDYAWFLVPLPVLLVVFADRHPRQPLVFATWGAALAGYGRILLLPAAIGAVTAGLFWLLIESTHSPLLKRSFALDHLKSVFVFALYIETVPRLFYLWERELGYQVRPLVNNAVASLTVADFWQRYNTRIHDWLYRNVFLPAGGRRHPVRAVWIVFLVSGLLHEIAFAIATMRLDGYQFTFFLLQAPAVLLSEHFKPRLRRAGPLVRGTAWLATWLWFATTSIFFFHGISRIFPCAYASKSWLP